MKTHKTYGVRTLVILAVLAADNFVGTGKPNLHKGRHLMRDGKRLARRLVRQVQFKIADAIEFCVDGVLNRVVGGAEWVLSCFPHRTGWVKRMNIPIAEVIAEVKTSPQAGKVIGVVHTDKPVAIKVKKVKKPARKTTKTAKRQLALAAQKSAKPRSRKLESMSVDELVALAKQKGIRANARWKKETLINKLGAV